jgi:hypothetical protein
MAYTNNSNPSTNNNNNIGNAGRPQRAKSEGAINIYMPNLNGTRAQLGTPLLTKKMLVVSTTNQ